ncbi:MAG: hypothetical protein C6W56_00275 [Caldibacillus debilis]|nr:MAG: hypothetical protein C6W56_00275 [Caldibacillus debilis]
MDVSILTNRKEGLKSFRRRRLSDCRKKGAEGKAGRGEWGRGRDGAIGQNLWGIPKAKKNFRKIRSADFKRAGRTGKVKGTDRKGKRSPRSGRKTHVL